MAVISGGYRQSVNEPLNASAKVRDALAAGLPGCPDTTSIVAIAEYIATIVHSDDLDDHQQPYITHPSRIAAAVQAAGGTPVQVALAWLHDTVEDHPDLTVEIVMSVFTSCLSGAATFTAADVTRLAAGLVAITHLRHEPRVLYWGRIRENEDAHFVKQFDINDNTLPWRVKGLEEGTRVRRAKKYQDARHFLGYDIPVH